MTQYRSQWHPSERLKALARRQGINLDYPLPSRERIGSELLEQPVAYVVRSLQRQRKLDGRTGNALIRIFQQYEDSWEWNRSYPTGKAFAQALEKNEVHHEGMRNIGEATLQHIRRVFLAELHGMALW